MVDSISPVWTLLGHALIPALAMALAGAVATFRAPGPNLRSALLHFAAGVVFAVVAVEFLPNLLQVHSAAVTAVGFATGTAAMLGVRSLTRRSEAQAKERDGGGEAIPSGLLLATGVDIVIDGLMLAIGFAAGAKEGELLTVALTVELVPLGLATAVALGQRRTKREWTVVLACGLALLFVLSAGAGGLLLQQLSGRTLAGVLSFGSAALLYLVTEELLTEAHEVSEKPLLTAAFFLGFLLILLFEMLG